jgi:hypothetical protein
MNGIGKSRLAALTKHYKENGACPRDFQYKGRNSKAMTFEESKRIVDFLSNISSIHALALPGRVPGMIAISIVL